MPQSNDGDQIVQSVNRIKTNPALDIRHARVETEFCPFEQKIQAQCDDFREKLVKFEKTAPIHPGRAILYTPRGAVMKSVVVIVAVVVGIWLFDRLMLAAEARGWVYWRKRKASPGSFGNALMEIESIYNPSKKNVVEEIKKQHEEEDDEGDPPVPKS